MDIALEWEWDNNKVATDFARGDFRKLFDVEANFGVAIVQTRVDGRRGSTQADESVRMLQGRRDKYQRDDREVALIEIRRVQDRLGRVDFTCYWHDMRGQAHKLLKLSYP